MKAWNIFKETNDTDYHKYDVKSNFKLDTLPIPKCGDDEVLIETKACSINPVDYKIMCEIIPVFVGKYPWIPGVDGAGVVKSIGKDVKKIKVGDRVCVHCNMLNKYNTFAEFFVAKEHVVGKIPEGVSFVEAASVPCAGMTSFDALIRRMKVEKDKSIFIYSGSGGCGVYAIQFAKIIGMSPIITSSSPKNFEMCKKLGADYCIDYKDNVVEEVKKLTNGEGVKYCFNTYSAETATKDYEMLAYHGSLAALLGFPDFSKWPGFVKGFSFHEICLGAVHTNGTKKDQEDLCNMMEQIFAWMSEKKVVSLISAEFKFEELDEAVIFLKDKKVKPGKVVVNFEN